MAETSRLAQSSEWIDLSFVKCERTPTPIIEIGIRLHLAGLSLSNTVSEFGKLGVERSRTAVHDWVKKTELEPTSDASPTQIAVGETK
jgi:putative transposase